MTKTYLKWVEYRESQQITNSVFYVAVLWLLDEYCIFLLLFKMPVFILCSFFCDFFLRFGVFLKYLETFRYFVVNQTTLII